MKLLAMTFAFVFGQMAFAHPQCQRDADCHYGWYCSGGSCVDTYSSCHSDNECPSGNTCSNGACVQGVMPFLESVQLFTSATPVSANYMCAKNPADPVFNQRVQVSGSKVIADGKRLTLYKTIHTTLNNGTQAVGLRVGDGDWFWGLLCLPVR